MLLLIAFAVVEVYASEETSIEKVHTEYAWIDMMLYSLMNRLWYHKNSNSKQK